MQTIDVNDRHVAGMVNAMRKALYAILETLPTKDQVRMDIQRILEVMETKGDSVEVRTEIATLKTFLTDIDWTE